MHKNNIASSSLSRPSERFVKILVATWLTYACYSMLRRPLSIVRSKMISDGEMTMSESGAIDTCFLIFYTFGQLYYSSIRSFLGKLPSRKILTFGLAGSALCVLCFAVFSFHSSILRCLIWCALGLVQAVGWASCLVVLTPWLSPSERGRVMGLWGTNMALGGVLGNTLSSSVLQYTNGSWISVFVVCAGLAGTVALSLPFWLGPHPNVVGIFTAAQEAKLTQIREGGGGLDLSRMHHSDLADECFYNNDHVDVEGEWIFQEPKDGVSSSSSSTVTPKNVSSNNNNPSKEDDHHPNENSSSSSSSVEKSNNNIHEDNIQTQHVSKIPGVLGIAISYFFHKLVRYVLMMWMPFYLNKQLRLDHATAGYMSTSFDIGGIVGTIGSGYLADWIGGGSRKAFTVTGFAIAMAFTLFGFASGMNEVGGGAKQNSSNNNNSVDDGGVAAAIAEYNHRLSMIITFALCFLAGGFSFGIDSLMTGSLLQDHCEKLNVSGRIGAVGAFVGAIGTLGSILQGPFAVVFSGYSWGSLFMTMVVMTGIAIAALFPVVKTEMIMANKGKNHR